MPTDANGGGDGARRTRDERPTEHRLPDATRLGPVRLQVADVERSLAFHRDVLGLRVSAREGARVELAAHGDDRLLVELHRVPGTRPARRSGRLGLYHLAIALPDRPSLGRFAQHLIELGVRAGSADHLVSEAFYLDDPDGLGVEVYADRPRTTWRRVGGELVMGTDPLDVDDLVRAAAGAPWRGVPAGSRIGHVHLHVGDLREAATFYGQGLGFDRTVWSYPSALFLGAGGYHHHVGVNTWAGPAATPSEADESRLMEWTIEVPEGADLAAVANRLAAIGVAVERAGTGLAVRDPWGQAVRIVTAGAPLDVPGLRGGRSP